MRSSQIDMPRIVARTVVATNLHKNENEIPICKIKWTGKVQTNCYPWVITLKSDVSWRCLRWYDVCWTPRGILRLASKFIPRSSTQSHQFHQSTVCGHKIPWNWLIFNCNCSKTSDLCRYFKNKSHFTVEFQEPNLKFMKYLIKPHTNKLICVEWLTNRLIRLFFSRSFQERWKLL